MTEKIRIDDFFNKQGRRICKKNGACSDRSQEQVEFTNHSKGERFFECLHKNQHGAKITDFCPIAIAQINQIPN